MSKPRQHLDDEFSSFVHASQARLLKLADMLAGDRGRAEDLVQHAYMSLYAAWLRHPPEDPEGYARKVVVNRYIDWWRRKPWRERPYSDVPEHGAQGNHADDLDRRRDVLSALARLTARERTAVVLRYYGDLSEKEIASEMGCALGTVKSTIARALCKLKNHAEVRAEADNARAI